MSGYFRTIAFFGGLLFSLSVPASSRIESMSGSVIASTSVSGATKASRGHRIATGSTLATGAKSHAVVHFDDGQRIVLGENTEITVSEYTFSPAEPNADSFKFRLNKGAIRSISGQFPARRRGAFSLQTRDVILGIQGTDFMVAIAVGTYISVMKGAVSATNEAGAAAFGSGMAAMVKSNNSLALTTSASTFPPVVHAAFAQLGSIALPPGTAAH